MNQQRNAERTVSLGRHRRACSVCGHHQREEIEAAFICGATGGHRRGIRTGRQGRRLKARERARTLQETPAERQGGSRNLLKNVGRHAEWKTESLYKARRAIGNASVRVLVSRYLPHSETRKCF